MNEEPTLEQIYKDIKEFAEKFSEPPILIDVKDDELREGLIKQLSDSGRDLSSIVVHHPRIPGRNFYKEMFDKSRIIVTESLQPRIHHSISTIPRPIMCSVESDYEYYYGIDMAKNTYKRDRNKKKRERRARRGK